MGAWFCAHYYVTPIYIKQQQSQFDQDKYDLTRLGESDRIMTKHHNSTRTDFGDDMVLFEIAIVRTGFVTGRKRAQGDEISSFRYRLLNLKCLTDTGGLNTAFSEEFFSTERIKEDFLTRRGDVLLRLSAPYTSVLIQDESLCGFLIPSHFAIIRADSSAILPEYLLWYLRCEQTKQQIFQNSSGSSAFGTISSGFVAALPIPVFPLNRQQILGQLTVLADREQELLRQLAEKKRQYLTAVTEAAFIKMKRGRQK